MRRFLFAAFLTGIVLPLLSDSPRQLPALIPLGFAGHAEAVSQVRKEVKETAAAVFDPM